MKRHDPLPVGTIIGHLVESAGQTATFAQRHACFEWANVVGPAINRQTTRRWVEGRTLHVTIISASLRNDLQFVAGTLVRRINQAVGKQVIDRIIFH